MALWSAKQLCLLKAKSENSCIALLCKVILYRTNCQQKVMYKSCCPEVISVPWEFNSVSWNFNSKDKQNKHNRHFIVYLSKMFYKKYTGVFSKGSGAAVVVMVVLEGR